MPKDAAVLPAGDVSIGDRTNMLFPEHVGHPRDRCDGRHGHWDEHPDGPDRHDVDIRGTHPIPLQKELDGLTKVLGIIAWVAVAFIVLVGWLRGVDLSDLLLLGTAMAISAIPTGMPAFVSALLSMGAHQLAEAKAVVKNLTDVGDPGFDQRHQHRQDRHPHA